jgi:hypothetical protein
MQGKHPVDPHPLVLRPVFPFRPIDFVQIVVEDVLSRYWISDFEADLPPRDLLTFPETFEGRELDGNCVDACW